PGFRQCRCQAFRRGVQNLAVGPYDRGYILCGLHPPLNLQGFDSCRRHPGDKIYTREIVGGKVVPVLALVLVLPSAGLGASSAIAAVSAEKRGEETLS